MQTLKNHITLIGNMGSKAQITNFENGVKVARFTFSTDKYTQPDKSPKSHLHRVFAWGNMARFIELYGEKGKQLAIHGRLVNRTYLNRQGKRRNVTEVEVKHLIGM